VLENLRASGLVEGDEAAADGARERRRNREGATELAWALFRAPDEVAATVKEKVGWERSSACGPRTGHRLRDAAPGRLRPRGRYLYTKLPLLAMYRPHKLFWLDQLLREGATAAARRTAPTSRPPTSRACAWC
jgi:KDO2-lipid IV(A) lauroyltransferase